MSKYHFQRIHDRLPSNLVYNTPDIKISWTINQIISHHLKQTLEKLFIEASFMERINQNHRTKAFGGRQSTHRLKLGLSNTL